jgi:hypothetical protein
MCEDYNIKKRERVRRYPQYYTEYIIITIKRLTSFLESN